MSSPFQNLPQDVHNEIFKHFSLYEMALASRISKNFNKYLNSDCQWKRIASLYRLPLNPGIQNVRDRVICLMRGIFTQDSIDLVGLSKIYTAKVIRLNTDPSHLRPEVFGQAKSITGLYQGVRFLGVKKGEAHLEVYTRDLQTGKWERARNLFDQNVLPP